LNQVLVLWGDVEQEEGYYDFTFLDLVVKNFQKDNRILLLTIMPFADWDQDKCHDERYVVEILLPRRLVRVKVDKPCDMDAYVRFLRALVERYDGDDKDDMPYYKL